MAAAAMGRQRRRARRRAWSVWARPGSEVAALLATALVGVIAALGWLADAGAGASPWWHLVLFVGGVLVLGIGAATLLRAWLGGRRWRTRRPRSGGGSASRTTTPSTSATTLSSLPPRSAVTSTRCTAIPSSGSSRTTSGRVTAGSVPSWSRTARATSRPSSPT